MLNLYINSRDIPIPDLNACQCLSRKLNNYMSVNTDILVNISPVATWSCTFSTTGISAFQGLVQPEHSKNTSACESKNSPYQQRRLKNNQHSNSFLVKINYGTRHRYGRKIATNLGRFNYINVC